MPAVVEPEELARLLDTAERPRAAGWSLRSALTRYAQPQPQRASDVIELLRRIEFALRTHAKALERGGDEIWQALAREDNGGAGGGDAALDGALIGLLRTLAEIDRLADVLATWAVDRATERPDAMVDAVVSEVATRLEKLGIAREARDGPRPRGANRRR